MVKWNTPAVLGVPARVAVPSRLSTKVTPVGKAPVSVNAAVGLPVVATVKVFAEFKAKAADASLVKLGAASGAQKASAIGLSDPMPARHAASRVKSR